MPDLSREQLTNAAIIVQVGRELGASTRDIQIALITAMTESRLINVNYGDRDSLGLFQQRAAWAPAEVRMDPYQSARMFFLGGQQGQRGLFDFKDRNQMGMGEAAQAVQVSAFPDRYITHLPTIREAWPSIERASGVDVRDMDGNSYGTQGQEKQPAPKDPTLGAPEFGSLAAPEFAALAARTAPGLGAPNQTRTGAETFLSPETNKQLKGLMGQSRYGKGIDGWRKGVVDLAMDYLGTPYVWGGADPNGFDCSGIIQYVYSQLGLELPRVSYQQANFGTKVKLGKLQPGDLVAWDNSSRNNGADHIAIYIGNGQILEAPRPGLSVRVRSLGDGEKAYGVKLNF